MRAFPVLFALAVLSAPAMALAADEVVVASSSAARLPTAAEVAAADAKARADRPESKVNTPDQVMAYLSNAPAIERSPSNPADYDAKPIRDKTGGRTVHGSAGVSIGTGGYRSGYVYSEIPIGETGTLGLYYSQTDYGKNGGLGYGYGGYNGYGYDGPGYGYGYGYGGYGRRGGTSQSLAVSYDMNSDGRTLTPEGCAPGFRAGDRYIEPLWVTQLRGHGDCRDDFAP